MESRVQEEDSTLQMLLKKGMENLASMGFCGDVDMEVSGRSCTSSSGASQRGLVRNVTLFDGHVDGDIRAKFSLGRELGRGAYGRVVVAVDKATGTEYACKIVPLGSSLNSANNKSNVQELMKEAEVMLHLRGHPNILKINSFFEDSENLYVVEELCSGGDLVEAITSNVMNMNEGIAAKLVQRILETLAHCHALGVIHRDIKLDNFLLSGEKGKDLADQLRFADFGSSEFADESAILSEMKGTREYMAPEVRYMAPEVYIKHYGFPSDVWSVGVCMYALLCGRFPFDVSQDLAKSQYLVTMYDPDLQHGQWKNISEEAKLCVKWLMAKNPGTRPTAAKATEHAWFYLEGVTRNKPLERPIRSRLKEFAAMTRFKREVLRLVAMMMDEKHKAGFRRIYLGISRGQDLLKVSVAEAALLQKGMPKEEIDAVRPFVRMDSDGCIDFVEFIAIVAASASGVKKTGMLESIFDLLDPEGTGYLTPDGVMTTLGLDDPSEVNTVLAEVGCHDGQMTKETFFECIFGPGGRDLSQGDYVQYKSSNPKNLRISQRSGACQIM